MNSEDVLLVLKEKTNEPKIKSPVGLEEIQLRLSVKYALQSLLPYEIPEGEDIDFAVLLSEVAFKEIFNGNCKEKCSFERIEKAVALLYKVKSIGASYLTLGGDSG